MQTAHRHSIKPLNDDQRSLHCARHTVALMRPTRPSAIIGDVTRTPDSTKVSLGQRLRARARERWPQLVDIHIRHRAEFAYITGELPDGTTLPLFRLRYNGSATIWGFAIYRASHDDYEPSFLPTGYPAGTPQDALDCACGLYLNDPTAWQPPTN
jgi:choline dehydrogenase-like flavoprotein